MKKFLIQAVLLALEGILAFFSFSNHMMIAAVLFALLCVLSLAAMVYGLASERGKGLAIAMIVIGFLAAALPFLVSVVLYEVTFTGHINTPMPSDYYRGLTQERVMFNDHFGVLSYTEPTQEEVVIVAHGNGSGYLAYLDVIEYFAKEGYYVFAYDATGYGGSEGFSRKGIPEAAVSLHQAIGAVRTNKKTTGRDIVLFGHSLGGYAVGSVLNTDPDVKAAIILAGFDSSLDMLKIYGRQSVGPLINVFLPYLSAYENIKFFRYASDTCTSGFLNTDARILVAHSTDDDEVPFEAGYGCWYERFHDDSRFTFIQTENSGHTRLMKDIGMDTFGQFIEK